MTHHTDTAPTVLLDMDVRPAATRAGLFAWEVFNAMTGSTYASGLAGNARDAEMTAVREIGKRTLHVRAGDGCWVVEVPGLGAVPLPLTLRATLDQALAHVRALPLARGKQVHGR